MRPRSFSKQILDRMRGRGAYPLGAIESPGRGASARRGSLLVGGWALGEKGPPEQVSILVDGRRAFPAEVGGQTPEVAAAHPGTPGAERCGWSAEVDLRGIGGASCELTLLADTGSRWEELDRVEIEVSPPAARGRRAVFTIVQNEPVFLPIWLDYYSRHFEPSDIYVLDHDSTDGSTEVLAGRCTPIPVHREESFDHMWLRGVVQDFQAFLLRSYETVLYAEVDELVVADPAGYQGLGDYIDRFDEIAVACTGFNVIQQPDESPIDFSRPILAQRGYWNESPQYSKRLLSRVPLSWNPGFHREYNAPEGTPDPELLLVHLHRVDREYCLRRHRSATARPWSQEDRMWNLGWHQRVVDPEEFDEWFYSGEDLEGSSPEPIPERFRSLL